MIKLSGENMNDFEMLGHFFAERFVIEYFDVDSIYLAMKTDSEYNCTICKLSNDDFVFLKRYLDVVDYEVFEDERK